uniref:acyltransferase family protein n=1 Tax=Rhodoblastus sp. TaxID=1962975 RepID=UPI0035B2A938
MTFEPFDALRERADDLPTNQPAARVATSEGAQEKARTRPASDIRIPALDGLRGLMTIFVVVSHYFGEVPTGLSGFCVGWLAVLVFFVLSGYLVGRLIVEKMHSGNFLRVFYLRRVCRTFPTYFLAVILIMMLERHFAPAGWMDTDKRLPSWSYLVFAQNVFLVLKQSFGMHWLSPTWTLALEEHFYLVAPFLLLLTPRRHWLKLLVGLALVSLGVRAYCVLQGSLVMAPIALLPAAGDVLFAGMILAVLVTSNAIPWDKYSLHFRVAPIVCLLLTALTQRLDGSVVGPWFEILGPFLIGIGAASLILMLVKGAPEAARFDYRILKFFGNISYSVYLTHLTVLGLMHGLLLGRAPDIASPVQILV